MPNNKEKCCEKCVIEQNTGWDENGEKFYIFHCGNSSCPCRRPAHSTEGLRAISNNVDLPEGVPQVATSPFKVEEPGGTEEEIDIVKETLDNVRYFGDIFKEPQGESWEEEFDKLWPSNFFTEKASTIDEMQNGAPLRKLISIKDFIKSLLSQTKREERQRILKIVEGMHRIDEDPYHESADEIDAYNEALSDVASRIQEEPKYND